MLMWNVKISVSELGPKDLFSPLYHLCRVCCSPSLLVVLQLWALKWVGVLSLEWGEGSKARTEEELREVGQWQI